MDDAQVDRVRRALRRRSKPPGEWSGAFGPAELWETAVAHDHSGGCG